MNTLIGLLLVTASLTACTGDNPDYMAGAQDDLAERPTPDLQTLDLDALSVPSEMVLVNGGSHVMGSDDGAADERPAHRVTLKSFLLDKTPVTVAAYRRCLGCTTPGTGKLCNWTSAAGAREDHPVNCTSWHQATAYCASLGKRLPTEEEWEYAARGEMDSTYAWGSEAPISPRKGKSQLCWDLADGTCPVGAFSATLVGQPAQPGASDLAGNVWEWMATIYCSYGAPPKCSEFHVLRGGAWNRTDPFDVRAARRNATVSDGQPTDVGFRCARSL